MGSRLRAVDPHAFEHCGPCSVLGLDEWAVVVQPDGGMEVPVCEWHALHPHDSGPLPPSQQAGSLTQGMRIR